MNITLKLPDDLCRAARHRAVDESKSLTLWMTELVTRELKSKAPNRDKSLLEMLGDPATADRDFELPDRKGDIPRKVEFP